MVAANNLPIYKVAYDLFGVVMDAVRNMPRDVKQLVGSRVATEAMDIVTLIFRANASANKVPHLGELLERLEVINLLLRLARDKRLISTKQYGTVKVFRFGCEHVMDSKNVGNCLNRYTCTKCGFSEVVDSSD